MREEEEQHESQEEAPRKVKLSPGSVVLTVERQTGKQGWDEVHKEPEAGLGPGVAGWMQGFDGLKWGKTESESR